MVVNSGIERAIQYSHAISSYLSLIHPCTNAVWEKLSILLNRFVPKLPASVEEDMPKGILEAIDMDSYRVEKLAAVKIQMDTLM